MYRIYLTRHGRHGVAGADRRGGVVRPAVLRQATVADIAAMHCAFRYSERAFALGRERGTRRGEAPGLCLLGEVAAAHDPPEAEAAERHYRDAIRVAGELGLRPIIARSHLGLRRLYVRVGRRNEAREHLIAAATMYREMDMRFYLEQAEAEMGA